MQVTESAPAAGIYHKETLPRRSQCSHTHVVLFEDYAVIDRPSRTYALGHVTRIVCKSKDFKNPVAFNDTRSQDINVYMKMYTRDTDTQYKMSAKISCYGFGDIMCHVNLSCDPTYKTCILHLENKKKHDLKTESERILAPKRKRTKTTATSSATSTQVTDDSGRHTVIMPAAQCAQVVSSSMNSDNPISRSSRTRTVIIHEFT